MKKIAIWLTYDLGVVGDFQGLYSWLNDMEAIECGNNNAYFKYSFSDTITSDAQLSNALKTDLEKKVSFKAGNRTQPLKNPRTAVFDKILTVK